MPFLTISFDFNSWYLDELPKDLKTEAQDLIKIQTSRIDRLEVDSKTKQYYITMGFNVACRTIYALPATIYVIELRTGRAVHPTLRKVAHKMDKALRDLFPGIVIHSDLEPSDWDIRRGDQDIIEKT